ncbi:ABC transporter substrate-binding protein [Evansella sp. AB-P1]|uniref:ABC transporter substrate-binding protein n=1 Tax=Evansella sp. AB-P1 TaxID=3037653 RepID=UPI0024201AB0|nr:ABC transporter substrate-binding protein [Evansella sp. AB-P1]MDG5789278.1 ABC transporter substrate-binding protein [Evansella sp. AB-P1]
MKKYLLFIIVISFLFIAAACGSNSSSSDEPTQLVISTWGYNEDLERKNIIEPFEEEHNVEIILDTGNNSDRLNRVRLDSSQIDIIYLSDYFAMQAIEEGLFETIDRSNVPNIEDMYEILQAPLGEEYGPAYTVGMFGLAYDTAAAETPVTSWGDLWRDEFSNRLAMPEITTTSGPMVVDFAAKQAGADPFDADLAFEKLQELSPNVLRFYGGSADLVNMFSQGEIIIGPTMDFAFDGIVDAVPTAELIIPDEGAYAYMNTINIVKGTENKELAEKFINWALSEELQTQNAIDGLNSPGNTLVELTEEQAEGLLYDSDVIESLIVLDWELVNNELEAWTDRWNREIVE